MAYGFKSRLPHDKGIPEIIDFYFKIKVFGVFYCSKPFVSGQPPTLLQQDERPINAF